MSLPNGRTRRRTAFSPLSLLGLVLLAAPWAGGCRPDEEITSPGAERPPLQAAGSTGQQLVGTEIRVTASPAFETSPILGADGSSNVIVFTSRDFTTSPTPNGEVYFQRIDNTGLVGAPVLVSTGGTDDALNDISGDFIVYISYVSAVSDLGEVKLYQISSGTTSVLSDLTTIREPRVNIHSLARYDVNVAWSEGNTGATRVMLVNLQHLARGERPMTIAGPNPPASDVEIGDRLVTWMERAGGQSDIKAYDLETQTVVSIAADPARNESTPSTSGPWVTWQSFTSAADQRIEAYNVDTREHRIVASNGALTLSPTIDGDFIAYESKVAGNFDVYLYRLSDGATFQVSSNPADQRLNNVFGNMVAYIDQRDGNPDVFVTAFDFVSRDATPPELTVPADITQTATGRDGAVVAYAVTATDNVDPHPNVTCAPPSGSLFPLGTTRVDCTATDESGNRAAGGFLVHIVPVTVEIDVNPGSPPFPIRLGGPVPVISVIVRTTPTLDAALVGVGTAMLGDGMGTDASVATVKGIPLATLVDVDRDGDRDLVLGFKKADLVATGDLTAGTTELVFRAALGDGRPVRGADPVQVVP